MESAFALPSSWNRVKHKLNIHFLTKQVFWWNKKSWYYTLKSFMKCLHYRDSFPLPFYLCLHFHGPRDYYIYLKERLP